MMSPRIFALGLIMGVSLGSFTPALGQEDEKTPDYESPQHFAVELKFGPYSPNLDDSAFSHKPTAPPFRQVFGSGNALLVQGEFDWQVWRSVVGNFGVGVGFGYYSKSAANCVRQSDTAPANCATTTPSDQSTLNLFPLSFLAVYRLDTLARYIHVPLVPFVKGGLNYTLWQIRSGGSTADYQTPILNSDGTPATDAQGNARISHDKGSGGTLGWQVNLGIALQIDAFDPQAAKSLDVDAGINHTYLFAEFVNAKVNGFNNEKKLDVGDRTLMGGLAFEF